MGDKNWYWVLQLLSSILFDILQSFPISIDLYCLHGSIIKRPTDSTTSGQTDTTSGHTSTTSGQTSTTNGQTSEQTSTTSGETSTTSTKSCQVSTA